MAVRTGLDTCIGNGFKAFHGKRVGVVCHQASIGSDYKHILDHLMPLHEAGKLEIVACFGPQHGIWGHTQDNMIEWEGYKDARTGLTFYSLYGERREPSPDMLENIDELIFDVQDVGARYYTFIWTLANCMAACDPLGIPITVLDRPNPIGGVQTEGPGHNMEFRSFVGLYPLPVRHGLTIAEVGRYLQSTYLPNVALKIVECEGWDRSQYQDETGLKWGLPSPNMPTIDTALVYPGQCLLEGTKLSEGRGTTRPFEISGAPGIDAWKLCDALNRHQIPGVFFRPIQFQPTFQKYAGEVCQGAFIHVTDRSRFRPVLCTAMLLTEILKYFPDAFQWQVPPYEYEYVKLPIDILSGGEQFRIAVEDGWNLSRWMEWIDSDGNQLISQTQEYKIYG
ncbi:DUF1343 domain-containing protein [Kamptonema cortianum]|nr:DUF1343 domain-containing protein [Geitlerinema splendidum]MDK3162251.1 DUF1343 domain-containing protein [Kamptonema cortianum]